MLNRLIESLVDLAVEEDIGDGDHTSLACIPAEASGKAQLLVKQEGILAGVDIAEMIFYKLDPEINFHKYIDDGSEVSPGDIAFLVSGKIMTLLKTERLVLNIMQRMSGIATQTHQHVEELKGLTTKVLDTRKTTPGMRLFDKLAVKLGGGENHRIGLFDMIMIKDNHIDFAGGIENAILRTKEYLAKNKKKLKIEVEARNIDDVKTILLVGGIDCIMLDNFTLKETREAVQLINGKVKTES